MANKRIHKESPTIHYLKLNVDGNPTMLEEVTATNVRYGAATDGSPVVACEINWDFKAFKSINQNVLFWRKDLLMRMILLFAGLFISVISFAQKLEENKTDDFTKSSIKRTTWEKLVSFPMKETTIQIRVTKIDTIEVLDWKFYDGSIFAVDANAKLMLMMEDNSIVTLYNLEHTLTCKGCGATNMVGSGEYGIYLRYPLFQDDISALKKQGIKKIRFYTSDGYVEQDVKEKNSSLLMNELKLID